MSKKEIVLYYTWAGHTRAMAEIIAAQTGADRKEILPKAPYSADYNTVVKQAKKEIREGFFPSLEPIDIDLRQYDTIYLGSPIWWGTIAPPVATYLSENDFSGKTILPFTTHGGGGKGHADRTIAEMCPQASVAEMYTAYEGGGANAKAGLSAWLEKNRPEGTLEKGAAI